MLLKNHPALHNYQYWHIQTSIYWFALHTDTSKDGLGGVMEQESDGHSHSVMAAEPYPNQRRITVPLS